MIAPAIRPQTASPALTGPYFGQKPPGAHPEVFAVNIATDQSHPGGFTFSKDGSETFFFSVDARGRYSVHYAARPNGRWTRPREIFHSDSANSAYPFFSPDGRKVFFSSDRRINASAKVPYYGIWISERTDEGWGEPRPASATINTGYENCGSFSSDGTLFFRRVSPDTRGDIFESDYANGTFTPPVKLPAGINTVYDESHPAVAPDGTYLVFSSKRPGGFSRGRDELWVSFKDAGGKWSKAVNLGKEINNGRNTSSPTISPDGSYMFFVRIDDGAGVSYWVSTTIIENLRPKEQTGK